MQTEQRVEGLLELVTKRAQNSRLATVRIWPGRDYGLIKKALLMVLDPDVEWITPTNRYDVTKLAMRQIEITNFWHNSSKLNRPAEPSSDSFSVLPYASNQGPIGSLQATT